MVLSAIELKVGRMSSCQGCTSADPFSHGVPNLHAVTTAACVRSLPSVHSLLFGCGGVVEVTRNAQLQVQGISQPTKSAEEACATGFHLQ